MADGFNSVGSALELEFYDAATGGNGLGRIRSYVGGAQALRPASLSTKELYDNIATKRNNRLYHWPDHQKDAKRVPGGLAIGASIIARNERLTAAEVDGLLRRYSSAFTTLPDAGTLTWDVDDAGVLAQVTLGGAPRYFQQLVNARIGDELILRVAQDATGGRVITWHGNYKFIGGAAPLEPAANAVTWYRLTVVAANAVLVGYLVPGGGGGLNQAAVDARIAAIRTLFGTAATPAAADRFFFTDENISGDPVRYASFRTLRQAILQWDEKAGTAGAAGVYTFTLSTNDREIWIGGIIREATDEGVDTALTGKPFPRALFSATPRYAIIDSRVPGNAPIPDTSTVGAQVTLSGNTLTVNISGWHQQGTPLVFSR